jgi:hypothetical protein
MSISQDEIQVYCGSKQSLSLFSKRRTSSVRNYRPIAILNNFSKVFEFITDQIFCIRQILEKKWEYNERVHHLFVDFKKAYDSVRRKVLYIILIEFGVPMKLVTLIKMRLNKTCGKVFVGIHLSENFPNQNGLKQGDALSPLLSTLL